MRMRCNYLKRGGLTGIISIHIILCSAQTTAEWIRQKKTRIEYLVQQIAAQQVYLADLEKGYGVVKDGLHVIRDIKHGDFDLHHRYFSSLSSVNREISNTDKAKSTAGIQARILAVNRGIRGWLSSPLLHPSEKDYITATLDNLAARCNRDIDKLSILITSGKSEMTDGQRLTDLDDTYRKEQQNYVFALHFRRSVQRMIASRQKEQQDLLSINSMYDLKHNR